MLAFRVDDMTCGHCASTITKAIREVDAAAKVEIDLALHLVRIEPTKANGRELSDAITGAGYMPAPVEQRSPAAAAPRQGGCCCASSSSGHPAKLHDDADSATSAVAQRGTHC